MTTPPRVGTKVRVPMGLTMVDAWVEDWYPSGRSWSVVVRIPVPGVEEPQATEYSWTTVVDVSWVEAA